MATPYRGRTFGRKCVKCKLAAWCTKGYCYNHCNDRVGHNKVKLPQPKPQIIQAPAPPPKIIYKPAPVVKPIVKPIPIKPSEIRIDFRPIINVNNNSNDNTEIKKLEERLEKLVDVKELSKLKSELEKKIQNVKNQSY